MTHESGARRGGATGALLRPQLVVPLPRVQLVRTARTAMLTWAPSGLPLGPPVVTAGITPGDVPRVAAASMDAALMSGAVRLAVPGVEHPLSCQVMLHNPVTGFASSGPSPHTVVFDLQDLVPAPSWLAVRVLDPAAPPAARDIVSQLAKAGGVPPPWLWSSLQSRWDDAGCPVEGVLVVLTGVDPFTAARDAADRAARPAGLQVCLPRVMRDEAAAVQSDFASQGYAPR